LRYELQPFDIKVQIINPGVYRTGFNERMAETAFRWLDDAKNFTKRAALRALFDAALKDERDPDELISAMIEIVQSDTGKFRNVVPLAAEKFLRENEKDAWELMI